MSYVDVVHIYSMVRAGYIPQLFSLRLPNPDVIFELLEKSNGQALIFESSFGSIQPRGRISAHAAVDARVHDVPSTALPPIRETGNGDDILMIFHTSGSTSGRPKLVPCSYSWWDALLDKARLSTVPSNPARQDVTLWM